MLVTFDQETSQVLAYLERLVGHGCPERVALTRAAKKYEQDRSYLRSLLRLQRESS
jgi:hypothetical protein